MERKRMCYNTLLMIFILFFCGILDCFSNPTFSKPHGFYEGDSITVAILPSIAGAHIRYTIDGSVPTDSSTLYTNPLVISKTTIIRAIEIVDGVASGATTVSYIFAESVLKQSNTPEGYPSKWGKLLYSKGNAPADYEMDPELTKDSVYRSRIIQGLKDIPILSIVTDKDNLFSTVQDDEKGGIYIYTGSYEGTGKGEGKGWTRPASVELFGFSSLAIDNPQILDMTADCGLRLHGGSSRTADKAPKHSFRLVFKKEYGEGKLNYPLFGEDEPTGYNQLILRSHFCLTWHYWVASMRHLSQFTRDVWARRMQRKMGHLSDNALYVNVFLNGMYWGLYNIAERVDGQFCKIHQDGKKSDYDVIKVEDDIEDVIEAVDGDLEKWNEMVELIRKGKDDKYYKRLIGEGSYEPLLDVDNFIDYMILNQMSGNKDWGRHNWFAIRKKGPESKGFQFICWDSEAIFLVVKDNVLSLNNEECPTEFFNQLIYNKRFADRYVKRAAELLSPNGLLGPNSVVAVWDSLYYTIQNAIYAESARWGDYRRDVHQYDKKGELYTADHYYTERKRLKNDYFPYRSQRVLESILSYIDRNTDSDYSTGIKNVERESQDSDYFNLEGEKIEKPGKGIYIKNKKKIFYH